MSKNFFQRAMPHLASVLIIITAAFIYCSPVLKGKTLAQPDILKHEALAKETHDYREMGEEPLWTSHVFSGMTTFNISTAFKTNVFIYLKKSFQSLPKGINVIFLSCLGFYLMLLMLGVNPWLALVGALAYGFSSNLLSSLMAGHNTKVMAIAYMAPAMGGVALAFRGKLLPGAFLMALFTGLLVAATHYQIAYYFLLTCVLAGVVYGFYAFREKQLPQFAKTAGVLVLAGLLGFAPNFSKVYNVYEHNKETIRGGNKPLAEATEKKSGGLDRSYAMSWSHGVLESFTVVVPNFMGGSSAEALPANGEVAELVGKQARNQKLKGPTYIGDQPFLQGVVYFGSGFIFLFILAIFVVDPKIRAWLLSVVVLSFFIAWGKNFSVFTDLLFDYLPFYNKFRTPSMALAMAGIAIPTLGVLGLAKIFAIDDKAAFKTAFMRALYVSGGLLVLLLLYGLVNDWTGPKDAELQSKAPWNNPTLYDALLADRKSLYLKDWMVSMVVMVITAGLIWFHKRGSIKMGVAIGILGVVFVADMWRVSKRYLNDDSFIAERQYDNQFAPTPADKYILSDNDPHFRVINFTTNPWTDGMTCYHHENIGGHHAAKIQRYQDMIEHHFSTQVPLLNQGISQTPQGLKMNPQVSQRMTAYNMMNTKYFIADTKKEGVILNPTACGNAWFVESIKQVSSHREEMDEVANIDPLRTAIVHEEFADDLYNYNFGKGAQASIELTSFKPHTMVYQSQNAQDGLAVFSEVIYTNGWKAYVDGVETDIYRVNYLIRAIKVPAGTHEIEMRFEPSSYAIGEGVSMAGSVLFLLLAGGLFFSLYRKKNQQ